MLISRLSCLGLMNNDYAIFRQPQNSHVPGFKRASKWRGSPCKYCPSQKDGFLQVAGDELDSFREVTAQAKAMRYDTWLKKRGGIADASS